MLPDDFDARGDDLQLAAFVHVAVQLAMLGGEGVGVRAPSVQAQGIVERRSTPR